MAAPEYDIFLSHAWIDGESPLRIAEALAKAGIRVWIDAVEINDFASITRAVTEGLAKSKAMLAYFSCSYPTRRACQWELTAAYLAAQNEGDPRNRVLVINPEKTADHIHPVELRDAKFYKTPTSEPELEKMVKSITEHLASVCGSLADLHPLAAPIWHGTSPVGSTRFVGRLAEMWEIHSVLHAGSFPQVTGASAVTGATGQIQGLAGVGKSLLAEEYAIRFGAAYPGGIFWLRAYGNIETYLSTAERESLRTDQILLIAARLSIPTEGLKPAEIEGKLGQLIASGGKPCLWIVDDLPAGMENTAVRCWFAPHSLAHTLFTTRSREYGSLANEVALSVLTPEAALQLLTSRRMPAGPKEDEQARGLADDLGCHALAIDVTASALQSYADLEPFETFRVELSQYDSDTLELSIELADALPNDHEKSITQTMLRSIRNLGAEGQDFLRLSTVLAVSPIPGLLVAAVLKTVDNLEQHEAEQRQRRAFYQTTTASLAEISADGHARSVHTLVSRAMHFHERSVPKRTEALESAAVEAFTWKLMQVRHIGEHFQITIDMPHARQLVGNLFHTGDKANLAQWIAQRDFECANYGSAKILQEQVVVVRLRELGKEHPRTLTATNNLARTLSAQGDLLSARQLQEQVVATRLEKMGREHPGTLVAMHDLAVTMHLQGELASAGQTLEEVVEASRRVQGESHSNTLAAMNALSVTRCAQGDYVRARQLQEQLITASLRLLGEQHPHTLTAMSNFAQTLNAQGEHAEAKHLIESVLSVRRRVQGAEHPETLTAMSVLASTLKVHGDLAGAISLRTHLLAVRLRVQGEEHPDTRAEMRGLAHLLSDEGDLASARQMLERWLTVESRVQGGEHRGMVLALNHLATNLYAQGDLAGAKHLEEQALAVSCRVQGEEHPETLSLMVNLAATLYAQGELEQARQLQERVLSVRCREQEDHPDTLLVMNDLALTLSLQGNLSGAEELQEKMLRIRTRAEALTKLQDT